MPWPGSPTYEAQTAFRVQEHHVDHKAAERYRTGSAEVPLRAGPSRLRREMREQRGPRFVSKLRKRKSSCISVRVAIRLSAGLAGDTPFFARIGSDGMGWPLRVLNPALVNVAWLVRAVCALSARERILS